MIVLTWKDDYRSGSRGGIALYTWEELRGRYYLKSHINGAEAGHPAFDTLDQLKKYAEIDFESWLKRVELTTIKKSRRVIRKRTKR